MYTMRIFTYIMLPEGRLLFSKLGMNEKYLYKISKNINSIINAFLQILLRYFIKTEYFNHIMSKRI